MIAAGLALAAAPVLARAAVAQGAKKPTLIFAGDETSEACKVWRDVMWPTLLDVTHSQP